MKAKFLIVQRGFTLTEIVVVIAIFGLVIIAVYSAYILSREAYLRGEDMAEITQNGRVILERISREIRQAKEIVIELPEEKISPPNEIKFHDGHFLLVSEEDNAREGSIKTITLASGAGSEDNYYKDMFIKIIGGKGVGETRKISGYEGATKIAEIEGNWETIPDNTSVYKIDSSFYYIHYYQDENNNIWRRVIIYCLSEIGSSVCLEPETYVSWDTTPPIGQNLLEVEIETPRIVGEYVTNLEFWGSRVINIFLILEEKGKSIELQTKIFGRNL